MRKVLSTNFFNRSTIQVARELLGKFLVRKVGRKTISGVITEVEAYIGTEDKASHASRGKTPRTEVMFGKPGHWYVYFTYGMHWMLNAVTERDGYPAAVLVRAVDSVYGPGRLTKALRIDKKFNTKKISKKTGLWVEDRGTKISPRLLGRGKRIGVDYAGLWKDKPWRFYLRIKNDHTSITSGPHIREGVRT